MSTEYGLKISADGVDVKTAALIDQTFNSQMNCLKIDAEGFVSSNDTGARDVQVAHGLSYRPTFMCFFQVDSGGKWFAQGGEDDQDGGACSVHPYADDTYITFMVFSTGAHNVQIHYTLMVDPGE